MDALTTGMAFVSSLGLAQVLLWVLAFAVIFGLLTKLSIFKRANAALVSIVASTFVLLAVPATVIAIVSTMSTGLIVLAIAMIALMALLEIAGTKKSWTDHGTIIALVLAGIAIALFVGAGGLALIGIASLPTIGMGTWLLVILGLAVLWMLSESKEASPATK